MKFKEKWKQFWTLQRHEKGGFTLIELIVVIAIMGVLAAGSSVAYSGYVKSAQKKADQTLVANIVRAIEMGTQSTMFTHDDSFKMGELSYPVGFISLSDAGAKVVTSNTDTKAPASEPCQFVTVTNATKVTSENARATCGLGSHDYTKYTVSGGQTVVYCATHTTPENVAAGLIKLEGENKKEYSTGCSCTKSGLHFSHQWSESTTTVSNTTIADTSCLWLRSSADATRCEYAYANQYGTFEGENKVGATTSGPLYDSITAAFGDVSSLKLEYDGWVNDDGFNYATFYTSAPTLMGDVKSLSNLLALASIEVLGVKGHELLGLTQKYDNGEQVLDVVSSTFTETYPTEDAWMAIWNAVADSTWDSEGFGMLGRENYSAARMGYNNGFAAYVKSRDKSFDTDGANERYLSNITAFYSQELLGVGLPGLICTDAFTDSESPLKDKINNETVFNLLAGYFEDYKGSDACEENGRVFYQTIKTFDATSDVAQDENNAYGGDMFEYYNSYVYEIAALYGEAQKEANGGIVIIVTVEGGDVRCDVSPASADLRKAN